MAIHAHKILEMMNGNSYTDDSLVAAIHQAFGENATFKTCSSDEQSANQIIETLRLKGKFKPTTNGEFTLNSSCQCHHDHDDEDDHTHPGGGCCSQHR